MSMGRRLKGCGSGKPNVSTVDRIVEDLGNELINETDDSVFRRYKRKLLKAAMVAKAISRMAVNGYPLYCAFRCFDSPIAHYFRGTNRWELD